MRGVLRGGLDPEVDVLRESWLGVEGDREAADDEALTFLALKNANSSSKSFDTFTGDFPGLAPEIFEGFHPLVSSHLRPELPIRLGFPPGRRNICAATGPYRNSNTYNTGSRPARDSDGRLPR